tara:strand:- start:402 stop:677 length:276 start_codon:yes stop_codon:yes gene_type:complete
MNYILIKELDINEFEVVIDKKTKTIHIVTLRDESYEKLTKKKISKKDLLKYSFAFLLDREPNTSILKTFELEIITRYFPEYESEIRKIIEN